jgi:hypothetical protein
MSARPPRRLLGLLTAALAIPLTWAGTAAAADEVNVYSSRHYDSDRALYDAFTKETGIRVRLIEGNADQLIERIRNEGANSPADVFITVDAAWPAPPRPASCSLSVPPWSKAASPPRCATPMASGLRSPPAPASSCTTRSVAGPRG